MKKTIIIGCSIAIILLVVGTVIFISGNEEEAVVDTPEEKEIVVDETDTNEKSIEEGTPEEETIQEDPRLVSFVEKHSDDTVALEVFVVKEFDEDANPIEFFEGTHILTVGELKEKVNNNETTYLDEIKRFVVDIYLMRQGFSSEEIDRLYAENNRGSSKEDFITVIRAEKLANQITSCSEELKWMNLDLVAEPHDELVEVYEEIDFLVPPSIIAHLFD
ncbi:hypothetical protein J2S00_000262 [Caldalkalibacillus uzonensis]|uniref:DUF4375 domain-containing protein n=1 Tax=Caldalkalibacillus uzonensis TaxID=353224 RepID=A0ABU0CM44_9BACI|nr:hypothetical protein [Caldalkalibacillus uzonensis]MDQ0337492.1 hypothetical protein [Caldalkalibacillus uzonensis]